MAWRNNYWSCSKFSGWLRNTVFKLPNKPSAATATEWKAWRQHSKTSNKIGYYVCEELLDDIQNFVNWPKDKLNDILYYISNRFIDRTHLIDTKLKPGSFHETESKIFYGMFEELVDFVEVQKAAMDAWTRTEGDRNFVPWTERFWVTRRLVPWCSQHHGVNHLIWETNLKKDDEWFGYCWREDSEAEQVAKEKAENTEYMRPTPQAENALEVLDLYCWYKFIRPNRVDPDDASGYTAWFDANSKNKKNNNEDDDDIFCMLDRNEKTDEEKQTWKHFNEKSNKIEEQYHTEDTEMMIRLVKVRRSLWT